ncbi:sunset domain-containing protein [Aureimonas ureilytica]
MRKSASTRFGRKESLLNGQRTVTELVHVSRQGRSPAPPSYLGSTLPFAARVALLAVAAFGATVGAGLAWPTLRSAASALAARQDCTIKGNLSEHGNIYHMQGDENYAETRIDTSRGERWFCTEAEAREAGWRRAKR